MSAKWEALQLQVALFFNKATPGEDFFRALTGEAPESQEERLKEGLRIQTGTMDGAFLQIVVNPIRADVFVNARIDAAVTLGMPPPTFGDFDIELQKFASRITAWLPSVTAPVSRLALVAKALAPAPSRQETYEILRDNLNSVVVDPERMSDLFFRVNWKVPTELVVERYLNRLTSWSSIAFRLNASSGAAQPTFIGEKHYAQREIDVNTPLEHLEQLPPADLAQLFQELLRVVVDTAATGEHP